MLTKETFIQLRDFIYERTGIYFTENKMYLMENRLVNRLNELGLSSFEDYYFYLKYGNEKTKTELLNLYDAVTTNETSFFRNPQQFDAFRTIVIKDYLENGQNTTFGLRIWSAACSTGEEPYTIAIVLLELMEYLKKNIPFSIYATDISPRVLESAKTGIYSEYSMRGVSDNIKKKYFTLTKEKNYKIKEDVKKFVRFDFMNLMDQEAYRLYRNMDTIFCRNVLIYFDEKAKRKVLENLYECLKPGGFLILGYAETLHQQRYGFRPLLFPGTIIYQKG
ncbi:MAG: protein-glutamate O-methyltransferase CheR [Deltaproteobacteria bacterium]|nr:protein-glutamate O-methyltransferase CheR [Deltaproteobacteria bacterium]